MSVADWIRLFRLKDVRSLGGMQCVFVRVAALLSLSGGWLATGTAESSRLLSLSSGKEIEKNLHPAVPAVPFHLRGRPPPCT